MDFYSVKQMTNASSLKDKLLDLGCGTRPIAGWTNVDMYPGEGVDVVLDLDTPTWPWADNSIQEIFSSHTIEHVKDCVHFMKECHRILAPGGYCTIRVPHGWNEAAMGDPTHQRPFFMWTMSAFNRGYDESNTFSLQHMKQGRWNFTWEIVQMEMMMMDWVKKWPFWRRWSIHLAQYINNVCSEIKVIYKKPITEQIKEK